jgi:SAM-dependent methyltransferase
VLLRQITGPAPDYEPFPDIPRRNFLQQVLEVPTLVHCLRLPARARVLEVGCGRGVALPRLAALLQPTRLVGVDIDADLLRMANERLQRTKVAAELYRADVRALPFASGTFDVVLDFGTCYHITDPTRALREIVRVLGPEGLFVSETVSSQLLSHPLRTRGQRLPWAAVPELRLERQALLWKSRRKAVSVALLLGLSNLSGCTSWQEKEVAPAQLVADQHPSTVRVTRADQSRVVLQQPTIGGDTLVGMVAAGRPRGETRIALADVKRIEVRHFSAGRTIGLAAAVPAVALGVFLVTCTGECLERSK